jgi:hypothetical protein
VNEAQKLSKAQENRTAKRYGGSRNAMSGAGWMRKGDVRTDRFMFENKLRMRDSKSPKSYTLKSDDLVKLSREAAMDGRIPVMQLDLDGRQYVILREDDFHELIE